MLWFPPSEESSPHAVELMRRTVEREQREERPSFSTCCLWSLQESQVHRGVINQTCCSEGAAGVSGSSGSRLPLQSVSAGVSLVSHWCLTGVCSWSPSPPRQRWQSEVENWSSTDKPSPRLHLWSEGRDHVIPNPSWSYSNTLGHMCPVTGWIPAQRPEEKFVPSPTD
ncbi:unnamed protein product [Pleuronectes platessa]|uniref:Uncharacterized protein n=1 Tax=Pleuronectes platessa TaxID=8262 RepID=A0A9N7VT83_PLEPL|nr:unnamed protein product [Pleuronectes platessa]